MLRARVLGCAALVLLAWSLPPLLCAASAAPTAQSGARPGAPLGELPAALTRRPEDLPGAEPERWARFFDPAAQAEIGRSLAPGTLDGMTFAQAAYGQGLFVPALETLHQVLTREPDFPPAWLVAGATYWRLRRYGDAVHAYGRFLAVAPNQVARTHGMGHALYGLGRFADAREHYQRVLAEVTDRAEIWRGLALAELRLGNGEAALGHLDRVLELSPDDGDALTWRAETLLELERFDDALAEAERAAALAPGDPRPRWIAMESLFALGRDDEAEQRQSDWRRLDRFASQRRAIEARLLLEPRQPLLARQLVQNAVDVGDRGLVRAALERLRGAGTTASFHCETSQFALETWLSLGADQEARVAALDIERRCASDASAWQRLALYWSVLGDADRAAEAQRRYLQLTGKGH
ncbi:MAG: tetratricopeptide repeat protein [Planctomycetaceae bacterium]|nr:tetratricopeptide repeat protein [Planctomycetaceae bacterium]